MNKRTPLFFAILTCLAAGGAVNAQATTQPSGSAALTTQTSSMDSLAKNKGQTQVANRIAGDFTVLAGSKENAVSLVNALRTGSAITLTEPNGGTTPPAGTDTAFTPPTGKMGWGNVFISLALAQKVLSQAGITEPTAAQLQAALMGGDIVGLDGKTIALEGILTQRASGMGWGEIAKTYGTKLGPVVSSIKSANQRLAASTDPSTTTTADATKSAKTKVTTAASAKSGVSASGKGLTTAAGGASVGAKGMTTADNSPGAGKGHKGITTASGKSAGQAVKGLTTAAGTTAGSQTGIVSAEGGKSHGHAYGRGVVTAAGGSTGAVGSMAAARGGASAGVVAANGASVSANATGVTTGNGNANGRGNGNGNGKGKGG